VTEQPNNAGEPVLRESETAKLSIYAAQMFIAGACIIGAVAHAVYPNRVDETTAALLALAAIVLFFDRLTKFKGFGIEFEKRVIERLNSVQANVNAVHEEVTSVQENVDDLGKNVGPGGRLPLATPTNVTESRSVNPDELDPNDPNKNQFGGSEVANDRILEAVVTPLRGQDSPFCRVSAKVRSTSPDKHPLTGSVKFYLHPTFGRGNVFSVDVKDGIAESSFNAYGAFTIGAEADDGATRLEFDLVNAKGGTPRFREN
jgi:hypothetical protein